MTKLRWCISLFLLAACDDTTAAPSYLFTEGSGTRNILEIEYDTIWSYGGPKDTVFGEPILLKATTEGALYVLDVAPPAVVRFSPTGELDWRWSDIGEGSGEVREVRAFDVTPNSGIVLADASICRLVFIDNQGRVTRDQRPTCHSSLFEGVAVLANGDIILDTSGDPPWVLEPRSGAEGVFLAPPWEGFKTMPFVQRYGLVESRGSGSGWVFGLATGNGWFVSEGSEIKNTFPYVEHTKFPDISISKSKSGNRTRTVTRLVQRPLVAAYDIDVNMDTMYVLSRGKTSSDRMIDKYSIQDGTYLYSYLLPDRAISFAVYDNIVYILSRNQGLYGQVTALNTRRKM